MSFILYYEIFSPFSYWSKNSNDQPALDAWKHGFQECVNEKSIRQYSDLWKPSTKGGGGV